MELDLISFSTCLILFISLVQQGFAQFNPFQPSSQNTSDDRKCFICNSFYDPYCTDAKFNERYVQLTPCREWVKTQPSFKNGTVITHHFVCRKIVQKATLSGVTDTRIVRTCGYMPPNKKQAWEDEEEDVVEDRCYRRAGTYEVMVTYCTCIDKDGCNGGLKSAGQVELWIALVGTLISSLLAKIVS